MEDINLVGHGKNQRIDCNSGLCLCRFKMLIRRFQRNPTYIKFMTSNVWRNNLKAIQWRDNWRSTARNGTRRNHTIYLIMR